MPPDSRHRSWSLVQAQVRDPDIPPLHDYWQAQTAGPALLRPEMLQQPNSSLGVASERTRMRCLVVLLSAQPPIQLTAAIARVALRLVADTSYLPISAAANSVITLMRRHAMQLQSARSLCTTSRNQAPLLSFRSFRIHCGLGEVNSEEAVVVGYPAVSLRHLKVGDFLAACALSDWPFQAVCRRRQLAVTGALSVRRDRHFNT